MQKIESKQKLFYKKNKIKFLLCFCIILGDLFIAIKYYNHATYKQGKIKVIIFWTTF